MLLSVAGGTVFSTLDLAQAYQQVMLDHDSKEMGYNHHPQGSVPSKSSTIWCSVHTVNVPADHGEYLAGHAWGDGLHR